MRRLVTKPVFTRQYPGIETICKTLTLCAISHTAGSSPRNLEEYRYTAQHQTQSSPEVFDDEILHHSMVKSSPQYAVHVLDQGEISLVQRIFFCLVPVIQRDLFTVVYQPRVLEAELALEARLISDIFAERWGQCTHNISRELHEKRHEEQSFAAYAARK